MSNPEIQTELPCITDARTNPECKAYEPPETSEGLRAFFKALGRFFEMVGPVLKLLFYGALILLLGYTLYYLFDRFEWKEGRPHRKPKAEKKAIRKTRTAPKPLRPTIPTLQEADQMAAEGNFADAVHFLLLAALDVVQTKLRGLLNISQTSREIIRNDLLPRQDRELLYPIVTQVERSLFAGAQTLQADYELCRDKFVQLSQGQEAPS